MRKGTPLTELESLSASAAELLQACDIHSVEDLARASVEKMTSIPGIGEGGQKSAEALIRRAAEFLREREEAEPERSEAIESEAIERVDEAVGEAVEVQEEESAVERMPTPEALAAALEMRFRRISRADWLFRKLGLSKDVSLAVRTIGNYTFQLPSVPANVALAVRTIGNYTFYLPWVPPRVPKSSPLLTITQRVTEVFRKLDECLAGQKKRRLRRLAWEAGLRASTVSESGISLCRKWRWWGWWLVDSVFCGVWLATWFDLPLTPKVSVWLILLAGGLPWLAVAAMAAGVAVIALAIQLLSAVGIWAGERKLQGVPQHR